MDLAKENQILKKAVQIQNAKLQDKAGVEAENQQLKQALAETILERDFFEGALQKVEARRQPNGKAGETASTPRSRR